MATDIELTAISGDEEELEEGEIDSSDGEEDKEQPEGSDKPPETVNNTPEPNEQRDTRKRELSPAQNEMSPSSRNEKRAKIDQSDGETNLEDGEIFSDDEEAAYYPQLVRSRNKVKKDKKERTPSPSLSHSPVSHSDDEQRTHRETDRHSRRDKKDSLDVHRPYGRYSQNSRNHRSPHRSPRRDTPTSRDRFSGGRTASRNSNTHNLIGQPIRHDRTSRWEEPSRGGANTVLTPQIIESRLKQGLSLLQTPRTNPIYSLDELNYPAAPQWYMKSVYAYNRRTGQRRGGGGPIGGAYRDYRSSYPSVGVNRESTRNGDEEDQVNEEVRGVEESKSLEMVEQVSEDEAVPMDTAPPVIAVDSVVETTQSVPAGIAQPLPSSEDGPSDPPSTSTNDLKVSIPLSQVAVTTHPVTPTENSDFNYDDYLDQLIDEEDGDTTREVKATDSNIPSSLPDKFWIDTGPVSDSKPAQLLSETGFQPPQAPPRDPLEEDFPSVTSGGKAVSNTNDLVNNTLRALVNQDSIDDTIASEEGKDVRQSSKKPNKSARRKQKDRLWLAKQEAQEKREQDQFSKPRQPCKYFQSGYCIHGDNCQYSHDVVRDKKKEVCKFYLQDGCSKGDNCLFYHGEFPCKFHHTGVVCYHGDSCKFSHAPLTKDTYDMLMAVVDPSLRDKVPLPGHPPPSSHNMQHQLSPPLMQPPLLPQPDFHHQQQPQAPPRPLMGAYPPPPGVPPLAPPQQWMGPPTPQDPPGFRPPLPMAPPPHQQWTGTPAPFPPGPHPLADGMGLWQEPPPPGGLPPPQGNGVPPASAAPEGPKLDANVPLPQGFDVKTLFPDSHPQILPHDLATKLRKTLLPTPSNTNVTQPTLELEYWEHQDQINSPPGPGPVGPPGGPPQQQPFLPPPGPYHGPPQSGFSPPHDPYQQPPPIHRPPPSQPLLPGPPSAQSQQDPRFSRQRPPYQPQPAPQGPPYPLHGGPAITGPPNQFIPQPAVPTENPVSDPRGWAAPGTRPASDPPSTGDPRGDRAEPAKRSIDPRLKYAHLKIKSRSNTSASTATTTSSTHTTSDSHSFKVPGLLQDRSQLSKPLALHELFGGAEEEQSAEQQPISLFGSSKYYHKTNSQSIPTSPITNKQGFGEIIMDTSGPLRRKSLEDKRKDSLTIDETNEEENDFVPSYLTHLGLEKDSDTSGLKIDSAFGDLKERQRRLSEIGSSLSEESRDEVLGSPKNGSPRLTRTFSFGSNL